MCARMLELAFETRLDLMCENRHRIKTTAQKNKGMRQKRKWGIVSLWPPGRAPGRNAYAQPPSPTRQTNREDTSKISRNWNTRKKKEKNKRTVYPNTEPRCWVVAKRGRERHADVPVPPACAGGSGARPCAQLRSTIRPRGRKKGGGRKTLCEKVEGGRRSVEKLSPAWLVQTPLARSTA